MYEENQSQVPASFMMLYVKPHQYKPSLPRAELTQRYELCEDLANTLVDTVSTQQFQLGITEDDALEKCWRGLLLQPELVNGAESFWVVCRLAEILAWPLPESTWS
ncbi:MAG: hypothetical protein RL462_263 [Pseudomonadota bacterium]|jgi:hypothetical protein